MYREYVQLFFYFVTYYVQELCLRSLYIYTYIISFIIIISLHDIPLYAIILSLVNWIYCSSWPKFIIFIQGMNLETNQNKTNRWYHVLLVFLCIIVFLDWGTIIVCSHGNWIYNYLCNQCLSPLTLWVWVRIPIRQGVFDITLCYKVCQWQVGGFLWLSSTNKTDHHDIMEI